MSNNDAIVIEELEAETVRIVNMPMYDMYCSDFPPEIAPDACAACDGAGCNNCDTSNPDA